MKRNAVSRNYDGAATYYDRLTDLVFGRLLGVERYRSRTIGLLGDLRGAYVLDIGCGTGRNFKLLRDRIGDRGTIVGVDLSAGMLARARERIESEGLNHNHLIRGDAARLDMLEGPFDAVTSMWCLGIVYDLEAALHRALDLLRPGGRIAVMDFGKSRPDRGPLRWLFPLYSRALKVTGIDSAEDLDNAKLQAKWARGRQVLESRLDRLHEEHYLQGAGLILAGRKPNATTPD